MEKKGKPIILIVDDKPTDILALESLLVDNDRIILNALNGKEALEITKNYDIDLIIIDVQMPNLDGFEIAQLFKKDNRTKDIPIIFVSEERKEYQFGMNSFEGEDFDYLYKPFEPEIVSAKVSVLLKL